MKLLLVGKPAPVGRQLAERTVRELRPEKLCVLTLTGLAVRAAETAAELGLPVVRFWPDFKAHRGLAMDRAVEQMIAVEGEVLMLVIGPRPDDKRVIKAMVRLGQQVVVGRFDCRRQIHWVARVPANQPPATSGTNTEPDEASTQLG